MNLWRSAAVLLLAAGAACSPEPTPPWHDATGYRWRELKPGSGGGDDGFTRMGSRTGVDFRNTVSDAALQGNRMLAQGAGVALGDVDGDGNVDVFLARTQGPNALYRNLGGWKFEDITARAGVAATDRYSSGAAFADFDGDGDLDLVLLATTGPNAVFVNDGSGRFLERRDLGLEAAGRGGTTVAMADVDGDGDLDLYVANYKPYSPVDTIPPQQRAMNQMVHQSGAGQYEVVPHLARDFKLVNRPDMGGLNVTMRGEPDDFYVNEGGRFTRVAGKSARFTGPKGEPLTEDEESFTLDARFADLTGDGAPDLYVANDFEDRDLLWINDGRGNFRRADWTAQRQISNSSMGIDVADLNGDARPDLFVADMLSNDTRRLRTQMPTHTALPKRPGDLETQLQQQRNTLFINRGDGTFGEVGMAAGVQASGWSWSTLLMDVDLDGWQDVLIANGHAWDLMDSDTQERLQSRLTEVHWQRQRWEFPRLPLRNVAFRNRGDLTFDDVSARWRFGVDEDISHALASADLDGDGDLDVVVNRLDAPALLLRNDAKAARVAVRLRGDAPNTSAVGARVRIIGGAVPVQETEIAVGGLYLSHRDFLTSFAMGSSDSATLVVDWRDGRRTTITGVRPNRLYEITAATAATPVTDQSAPDPAPPLFVDATPELRGHVHADPPFDDWQRQFLLPNALSQLGPGVAWFDFDRDNDEDLIVGTGRGGRLAVFRNDGGRLVRAASEGPEAQADLTTILGLAAGDSARVITGVAAWEGGAELTPWAQSIATSRAGLAPNSQPIGGRGASSTGPLALGDYDGDGDLDLFVGGRAVTAQYPRTPSSRLLRNDNGTFSIDSSHAEVLDSAGLVSAAMFADVDSDGDADLLLAREWDSLLLLLNQRGRLTPAPDSWGIARWTNRWNGVAAGDLNGDGRIDLVATAWGRNTLTPADSARPLVMLHGPFGSAGEEEMLLARHDNRVRGLAPLNSYPRVRTALPDLPRRIGTYAAYADATAEDVLGPALSRVKRKTAVTLDHMAFLNRGGRFEAVPLPREAQMAPAFYAGVADFDGDGREDVFLSQNFYPTAVGMPRYDNGRGLLLTGDSSGTLVPMDGARSGILVYGDQRGAAYSDIDADGRLDLVVSQNASATRLYRNRGAKPGLRVRVKGPAGNPDAIGAQIRLVFGDRMGPVREIQAGSGYWSQNGSVQVFGFRDAPTAVSVRWPGGRESRAPVSAQTREVVMTHPADGSR